MSNYFMCCFRDEVSEEEECSSSFVIKNNATFVKRRRFPLVFDDLNDSCVLKVFSFISITERIKLEVISRKWRRLIKKSLDDVTTLATTMSEYKCSEGESHGVEQNHVMSLGGKSDGEVDTLLKHMLMRCANVRTLVLSRCWVDEKLLETIISNCHRLEHLEITHVNYVGLNVGEFLKHVFIYSPTIKHFYINNITEEELNYVAILMTNLEELFVSFNPFVSTEGVPFLSQLRSPLKKLDIEGANPASVPSLIKNAKLKSYLQELSISRSTVTFATLKAFCKSFGSLKTLRVELKAEPLTGKSLFSRRMNLNYSLLELNVSLFGSQAISADNCSQSPELSFHNLTDITKHCPELRKLAFSGGLLTNDSMKRICRYCPKLEVLTVDYINSTVIKRNAELTDASCREISSLTNLKHLALNGAHISDDGFLHLLNSCPNLRDLKVKNCPLITDICADALKEMAKVSSGQLFRVEAHGTQINDQVKFMPSNLLLSLSPFRFIADDILVTYNGVEPQESVSAPNYFTFATKLLRRKSKTKPSNMSSTRV